MKQSINKPVNVTVVGFDKNTQIYPRQIELDGETYSFIDSGIRCTIRKGDKLTSILNVSDGIRDFRLRSGESGMWTLLSVSS